MVRVDAYFTYWSAVAHLVVLALAKCLPELAALLNTFAVMLCVLVAIFGSDIVCFRFRPRNATERAHLLWSHVLLHLGPVCLRMLLLGRSSPSRKDVDYASSMLAVFLLVWFVTPHQNAFGLEKVRSVYHIRRPALYAGVVILFAVGQNLCMKA